MTRNEPGPGTGPELDNIIFHEILRVDGQISQTNYPNFKVENIKQT